MLQVPSPGNQEPSLSPASMVLVPTPHGYCLQKVGYWGFCEMVLAVLSAKFPRRLWVVVTVASFHILESGAARWLHLLASQTAERPASSPGCPGLAAYVSLCCFERSDHVRTPGSLAHPFLFFFFPHLENGSVWRGTEGQVCVCSR